MKERKVYLDYLRVIATVFVIGIHTVSLAATMVTQGSREFYILGMQFIICHDKWCVAVAGKRRIDRDILWEAAF